MSEIYRRLLLIVPAGLCLVCGCFSEGVAGGCDSKRTAVVFSDIHFNPFYDPAIFPALNLADPGQWAGVFATSKVTAPSQWGADTNMPLLTLALSSIHGQAKDGPLVVFTGDLLGHNFAKTFFDLSGSHDLAAMQAFADKTAAFVMDQVRAAVGDVPVVFAVGNADSYSGVAPEAGFLANTAELYYTKFLKGLPDHQAFLDTFTKGGYYSADVPGTNLTVVSLNTLMLTGEDPSAADSDVTAQLAWLDTTLGSAGASGRRVWLLMHVPPGVAPSPTAGKLDSQGDLASAVMMWKPEYQASFLQVLAEHPDVVAMTFAGHTHMDEFRLVAGDVVHVSPGISPVFGNNPAYKVFEYSRMTLEAADYVALNYDLAASPLPGQFKAYYTFSSAYSMQGPLDAAMGQLYSELSTDSAKQSLFREYYYSGQTPANPITDANWPVYGCGIGNVDQDDLISCVNSYGN